MHKCCCAIVALEHLLLQVSAELNLARVPMLDGAAQCVAAGVLSSIHIQNAKSSAAVQNAEAATQHEAWPLLVDPQTGASNPILCTNLG